MKIKPQILSMKPYQPGKTSDDVKRIYNLSKVTKLASNENPFGFSPKVTKVIQENATPTGIYPDGYSRDLRMTLSSFLKVEPEQLIFGNGSDEVVQIICRALLSSETNTVMATPTFPQYRHNAKIEGAEVREVPLLDGYHDLDKMLEQIDENTAVVWLCSPNNPTGTYINNDKLQRFITNVPDHVLIVMDEAYYEYVQATDYPQSIELLPEYKNMMILRTFSKGYGLASFRIGYGIGHADFIQQIEPAREPFNTNRYAQLAAIAAIEDQEFLQYSIEKNEIGKKQLYFL